MSTPPCQTHGRGGNHEPPHRVIVGAPDFAEPQAFYLPAPFSLPDDLAAVPGSDVQRTLDYVLGESCTLANWRTAQAPAWIVPGVLQRSSVTLLSSVGGLGKSLLIQDLLIRLAAGDIGDWLGAFPLPGVPMRVTLIEAECGGRRLLRRTRELVMGDSFPPDIADLAVPNLSVYSADGLRRRGLVLQVLPLLLSRWTPTVLVVDPLRCILPESVEDENDNMVLGRVLDFLVALAKRHNVAVLVNDHDSKAGGAARGASSKRDAAEFLLHLTGSADDPGYYELATEKARDPGPSRKVGIRRVCGHPTADGLWPVRFEPVPLAADAAATAVSRAIREHLRSRGPTAQSELADVLPFPETTIKSAVLRMRRDEGDERVIVTGRTPKRSPILRLVDRPNTADEGDEA